MGGIPSIRYTGFLILLPRSATSSAQNRFILLNPKGPGALQDGSREAG
jgi:hypothetical protein